MKNGASESESSRSRTKANQRTTNDEKRKESETSPEQRETAYTEEQKETLDQGLRILARMIARARLRRQAEHRNTEAHSTPGSRGKEELTAALNAALEAGDLNLTTEILSEMARSQGMTKTAREAGLGQGILDKSLRAGPIRSSPRCSKSQAPWVSEYRQSQLLNEVAIRAGGRPDDWRPPAVGKLRGVLMDLPLAGPMLSPQPGFAATANTSTSK